MLPDLLQKLPLRGAYIIVLSKREGEREGEREEEREEDGRE